MEIKAIDRDSVQRICSGQVIVDLSVAVKELVENALVKYTGSLWPAPKPIYPRMLVRPQ